MPHVAHGRRQRRAVDSPAAEAQRVEKLSQQRGREAAIENSQARWMQLDREHKPRVVKLARTADDEYEIPSLTSAKTMLSTMNRSGDETFHAFRPTIRHATYLAGFQYRCILCEPVSRADNRRSHRYCQRGIKNAIPTTPD